DEHRVGEAFADNYPAAQARARDAGRRARETRGRPVPDRAAAHSPGGRHRRHA
ncbi:hypothetical protein H4S02_012551, partial [Coemansia sp. RSA 2611]